LSDDHQYILISVSGRYGTLTKVWKIDTQEEVFSVDHFYETSKFINQSRYLVFPIGEITVLDLLSKQEVYEGDVKLRMVNMISGVNQYLALGGGADLPGGGKVSWFRTLIAYAVAI
jgi:hypothetical protein